MDGSPCVLADSVDGAQYHIHTTAIQWGGVATGCQGDRMQNHLIDKPLGMFGGGGSKLG